MTVAQKAVSGFECCITSTQSCHIVYIYTGVLVVEVVVVKVK